MWVDVYEQFIDSTSIKRNSKYRTRNAICVRIMVSPLMI